MPDAPSYLYFILISIVVFNILGLFGNLNLIILHYRKPVLRTNYGWLLIILSSTQSICLLYENVNMSYAIHAYKFGHTIYRNICFYSIFPYVFFNAFQNGTMAAIAVDFFLCIAFPLAHRTFNRRFYFFSLLLLPALHGAWTTILGFLKTDNAEIQLCNPPSSLNPTINQTNYILNLTVCTITLIAYLFSLLILFCKTRRKQQVVIEKKALRSITVIVIVFVVIRYFAMLYINVLRFFGASKEFLASVQDFLVIFALIGFSQNCYVCYFRSSEYRSMLNEQCLPMIRLFQPAYDSKNQPSSTTHDGISKTEKLQKKKSLWKTKTRYPRVVSAKSLENNS